MALVTGGSQKITGCEKNFQGCRTLKGEGWAKDRLGRPGVLKAMKKKEERANGWKITQKKD